MVFQPGQSGNYSGRPKSSKNKIPSNKALKESMKKGCSEAVNATISYLREYRADSAAAKRRASEILNELTLTECPIEKEQLTNELRNALSDKDKAFDKTLKASFKILDTTYSLVMAEDRLDLTKKVSDEDDEEEDDSPAPVLQLTSVKP